MIDAGLPLVQCLDILANQTREQVVREDPDRASRTRVEQGATFSDALKQHPKVFDELYVNLVAAGEVGGILDTILNRLAIYIEKNVKLRGQLKSAMFYPIGIIVVAIGVIAVMLIKVIPTFEKHVSRHGSTPQLPGRDAVRHQHLARVHRTAGTCSPARCSASCSA